MVIVLSIMTDQATGINGPLRESWATIQGRSQGQNETKINVVPSQPSVSVSPQVRFTLANDGGFTPGQFSEWDLILETQNVDSRFAKRLGPRWHHYKHLEHLYHFNPKTIERLLDQAGLEIVHLTPRFGGKHVSLGFIRERATRVHGVMKYLLAPLAPLSGMSFYVNMRDEMVIVARKKK